MTIKNRNSLKKENELFIENRRGYEWLNSKDAASFLCISEGALRNLVYRGQIPFYKFGRRLRFRYSEIHALLKLKGA